MRLLLSVRQRGSGEWQFGGLPALGKTCVRFSASEPASRVGNDHVIMQTLNLSATSSIALAELPPLARTRAAASCGHVVMTLLVFATNNVRNVTRTCRAVAGWEGAGGSLFPRRWAKIRRGTAHRGECSTAEEMIGADSAGADGFDPCESDRLTGLDEVVDGRAACLSSGLMPFGRCKGGSRDKGHL